MPLRFDQLLDFNHGGLRRYWPYLVVSVALLASASCSFPSGSTETPLPGNNRGTYGDSFCQTDSHTPVSPTSFSGE